MLVKLIYFKPSGKYYSEATYVSDKEQLYEIWDEVKQRMVVKKLWGLMIGHSEFHILVDIPKHPHRHPHLILATAL